MISFTATKKCHISTKQMTDKTPFFFQKITHIFYSKRNRIIFIILIIGIDYIVAFQSSLFKITSATCFVGKYQCNQVIREKIQNKALQQNLLIFNGEELQRELKFTFPDIKDIQIKKQLPNSIKITITKRQASVVLLDGQKHYFLVDDNFRIYSEGYLQDAILLISQEHLALGEEIVSPTIRKGFELVQALEASLLPVKQIQLVSLCEIKTQLMSGQEVLFCGDKDIVKQVDSLQLILNHKQNTHDKNLLIKSIDLRFDDPVIK